MTETDPDIANLTDEERALAENPVVEPEDDDFVDDTPIEDLTPPRDVPDSAIQEADGLLEHMLDDDESQPDPAGEGS